jgi:hypothetical protein
MGEIDKRGCSEVECANRRGCLLGYEEGEEWNVDC